MNNTNQNSADSPLNAAKTLNSASVDNHTTKLEKALIRAFVPWMGNIKTDPIALIDASHCLLSSARGQLEVFQSIAGEIQAHDEIQIKAGSIVGFSEMLINQITALEVITDGLCGQIHKLSKKHLEVQKSLENLKAGGEA